MIIQPNCWVLVANPQSGFRRISRKMESATDFMAKNNQQIQIILESTKEKAQERLLQILNLPKNEKSPLKGIISIGGDGLLHMIANSIYPNHSHLPILIISNGSGNDFARSLGINRLSTKKLLRLALDKNPVDIDLITVNEKVVLNIFSTGFDAQINQRADKMPFFLSWLKYPICLAMEIVHLRKYQYILERKDGPHHFSALLTSIANGKFYGGGVKISPNSIINDGKAELMTICAISRLKLLALFPLAYKGLHLNRSSFSVETCESGVLTIVGDYRDKNRNGYGDGEFIGESPFTFALVKKAIKVWAK